MRLRLLFALLCWATVAAGQTIGVKTFDHFSKEHVKVACMACHARPDNQSAPRWPGHSDCIECHVKEFTSGETGFCAPCHQIPLSDNPVLAVFPKLQQMGIRPFSHHVHLNAAKTGNKPPACSFCHAVFSATGIAMEFPDHEQCYSCHVHQPQQQLADCAACHVIRANAAEPVKADSAFTRYKFKHQSHLKQLSIANRCEACHKLGSQESPDKPDMQRISTAQGQRHTSGCFACHDQKTEIVCSKCHAGKI